MKPSDELLRQLSREEIEGARKQSAAEKLALGGDLFDMAWEIMFAAARQANPDASDEELHERLRRRLEWAKKTETRI